jgi:V/A-type H+/Na+-transporting ATPase subunit D
LEVKKTKDEAKRLNAEYENKVASYSNIVGLWNEFDTSLLRINDVELSFKKIAGVKTPVLEKIDFHVENYCLFTNPAWFPDGISIMKDLATKAIENEVVKQKMAMLENARKKTTQKVNLYEKVQIPGFEDAILKIKRFLEDEENLSKSAQKIVKDRQQRKEGEE